MAIDLNKKVKKMDFWDVPLVKLSSIAFILFLITIWPAAMNLVVSISPWWFLVAFIILGIRPIYKVYIK